MPNQETTAKPTNHKEKSQKKLQLKKHAVAILLTANLLLFLVNITLLWFLPQQRAATTKTRSEILANNLQIQSAQKLLTDLNASQGEIDKIDTVLPSKSMLLQIIQEIETLKESATIQHFSFESEVPQEDKKGNFFLPLTLVIEGKIPEITRALNGLQQKPHIYTITQSRVESPSGLNEKVNLFLNVRIYVKEEFNQN